jgi:hypothetical protein
MKHILLLFILNTFFVKHISAQNPNLEWAFGMGDSISCINNLTIGNKVLAANDGHIYITGLFCNTVDFDYSEKKFELKSNIEPSNYIAKYDTNGNFIWAKKIEGEVLISSIKVDLENNIYLSGDFQGFISFDSTLTKTPFYFGSNGYADAIAIKIDSKGQLVWAKTFGNKNYENIASSEIDASGSLYLFGNFADTVDFDPSPNIYNLHSVNERCDFFVVKLDKNGNFLWAKTIGGTGVDALCNTTSNKLNNIYLIGRFSDSISLKIANCNSTIYTQPSDTNINAHFSNLFILKMDTAGKFCLDKTNIEFNFPLSKNCG